MVLGGVVGTAAAGGTIVIASLWYNGATLIGTQVNQCYSTSPEQIVIQPFVFTPGSTAARTIELKLGTVSGLNYYVNADGSNNQIFNSTAQSSLTILELKA